MKPTNVRKATHKRKSWARFNFYVYAWPFTHSLYFIYAHTHGKITWQWKCTFSHERKKRQSSPQKLKLVILLFCYICANLPSLNVQNWNALLSLIQKKITKVVIILNSLNFIEFTSSRYYSLKRLEAIGWISGYILKRSTLFLNPSHLWKFLDCLKSPLFALVSFLFVQFLFCFVLFCFYRESTLSKRYFALFPDLLATTNGGDRHRQRTVKSVELKLPWLWIFPTKIQN